MMNNNKKNKLMILAAAVALTVALTGCSSTLGTSTQQPTETTDAVGAILLSVNPEIEIEYDKNGTVLEVEGINEDGQSVVTDYNEYEGRDCTEVINALVQKIYEGGYLDNQFEGNAKNIVIKLENGSQQLGEDFLEKVADGVRNVVNAHGGASGTLMVSEDDLDDQGLIGTEKAREIVLAQLGLAEAVFSEGEYELDDGIYELEFTADGVEYEYEVDAVTGKVLEANRETNDDWNRWDDDADDWDDERDDDTLASDYDDDADDDSADGKKDAFDDYDDIDDDTNDFDTDDDTNDQYDDDDENDDNDEDFDDDQDDD